MWTYDPETGTYSISNLTAQEMGTLAAAMCAGFAIVPLRDPLGAEAARRNLITYTHELGQAQTNRLLEVIIAADTHRIHHR
jgi:hypothetical protein